MKWTRWIRALLGAALGGIIASALTGDGGFLAGAGSPVAVPVGMLAGLLLGPTRGRWLLWPAAVALSGAEPARMLVVGLLAGAAGELLQLGKIPPLGINLPIAGAQTGFLLGLTPARDVVWIAAAGLGALVVLVSATPLMERLARRMLHIDPLHQADAVVVLAAGLRQDGSLTCATQGRVLRAYSLLGEGLAPRLVVARLPGDRSWAGTLREQMAMLGGTGYPVEEAGCSHNTHDEALAVARLMRERGWERVIIVTDPLHTRRASATFAAAGVPASCAAAIQLEYDTLRLTSRRDRLRAFGDLLHEVVGYEVYRRRGWIRETGTR